MLIPDSCLRYGVQCENYLLSFHWRVVRELMYFLTLGNSRFVEFWYLEDVKITVGVSGSLAGTHANLSFRYNKVFLFFAVQCNFTANLVRMTVPFLLSKLYLNLRFASIVAEFSYI